MIKANELRIGNWLRYGTGSIEDSENVRIETIGLDGINHQTLNTHPDDAGGGEDFIIKYEFDALNPIPLTSEILEKFGFVNNRMGGHYNNIYILNDVEICDSSKVFECPFAYMRYHHKETGKKYFTAISFVHQLQNLIFALTGEELKIDL